MKSKVESGFGLGGLMAALTIGAVILGSFVTTFSNITKTGRKSDSTADLIVAKLRIANSIDCSKLYATPPASPPPPPCSAGTYVTLKDVRGTTIVDAGGTRSGKFTLRSRCTDGGIDVRAAWISPAAVGNPDALDFDHAANSEFFVRDEVANNLYYSWAHPKAYLFSSFSGSDDRLCKESFGGSGSGSVNCPANQYMTGFNFATKEVLCQNMTSNITASCPLGQALRAIVAGVPQCVPVPCPKYSHTPVNGSDPECGPHCREQLTDAGRTLGLHVPANLSNATVATNFYSQIRTTGAGLGCDPLEGTVFY